MASKKIAKAIIVREDFEGMSQIWPPPDSQIKTRSDLVFVPGLAGGCIKTWIHENEQCWLDWLLLEIPDIRIFAFGYKADSVYLKAENDQGHGHGRTFTDAEDLCNALRDTPGRVENPCPLTIIGHGVGGIIVKNALVLCNALPTIYGQILRDSHHVIFLDTPHLGLDTKVWLAVYGKLATDQANQQFGLWSQGLTDLGKYFGGISTKLSITSAYSANPIESDDGSITVVQESLSMLYFPNETRLSLSNTNHLTMCKFSNQKDANYRKLRDRIAAEIRNQQKLKLIGMSSGGNTLEMEAQLKSIRGQVDKIQADNKTLLVNSTRAQTEQERAEREKLKSKMLKWLIPSDQAIDYDADLESDRTKAVDNTCTWIFGTDEYEDWMSTELSKICWVHGIPGCGKSTLVASTCRSVSEDHGQVVHFFFRPDSSFSAAFALSCLTHQMLYMSDTVFEALRPKYEKTRAPTVQSHTTATAVFKIALKAFGDCIIFLDALDNCKDRGALLNVLTQLVVEMPFGIKIFCSSRDEHDILRTLSDSPSVLEIPVSKDKIKQEISTFIRITVNQNADLIEKLKDHPEALEYIISQLCDGAQGMFLLPKYFIEDLSAMTDIEQMYNFMNDLPRDVQSYYLQIVSGMDSRYWNLARKVFTWTAWARRPLSLAELDQVLCIDHPDYLSLRQDIKRALGCLVTLENDLVRLSHDSVRRFVLESSAFKSSQIYRHLVPSKPGDDIAEACAKFVFMGTYKRPASPDHRFAGQRAALFRETCPFLEYASYNWVFHWSMTSKPLRLLPSVVRFFESYQLLDWVESVGHFLISEGFETIISTLRNFLVKLQLGIQRRHKVKDDLIRAWLHLFRLRKISGRLSKLSTFLNSWDATIRNFPDEIHILAPLLETSFSAHKLQDVLITRHPQRTDSAKLYNLLDSLTLPRSYDRFMLSDLHIFMWQSLMPSIPWNLSYVPLDPQRPEKIQLTSISITTSIPHGREGKDPAEVGSITVTTTLRKDLRVVGISWARFSEDKSQPLAIKSYAWSLAEDPRTAILYPFSWSHLGDDDPCRVDITITHAFRMSKCALAFTDDLQTMWTAGGTYNIRTGYHRPAPRLFTNSRMRALTFSRNCAIIAGVRDSQFLEIYDLPRLCRIAPPLCCIASYKGDCTLLGVSPLGKFVLFLEKLDCDDPAPDLLETPRPSHYAVSLLSHSGTRTVIWTDEQFSEARRQSPSRSPSPDRKPFSLEEYYNSGGLHAFSQNDTVLVLCVPASPDWELLGFDLQTSDIRNSCWSIEYSSILLGAGITSISFCPIHERRLYLLDSYCVMRSFEIVRSDVTSGSQISTVEGEDLPPVWTLIPQTSEKPVVTITLAQEDDADDPFLSDVLVNEWTLKETPPENASCSYGRLAKSIRTLQSQTVVADISALAHNMTAQEVSRISRWDQLWMGAQDSIDATVSGTIEAFGKVESLDLSRVGTKLKPRVTTNITFDHSATLGFFQSVIYIPQPPDKDDQPQWSVSMIMDIRWLEIPKWRKTGSWNFATVVSKEGESLITIYHPPTKTLVYAVSLLNFDKAANEHWIETSIMVCQLSSQPLTRIELDSRANYLISRRLRPDCGFIEALEFSNCGNYVFGYSSTWPGSIFQLDIRTGTRDTIVRQLYDPFGCGVVLCTGFSFLDGQLYVAGTTGALIILLKFSFADNNKYQTTTAASCPFEILRCSNLSLIWPSNLDGKLMIVCHGTNYLRKDGKFATTPLWPMVFSVSLDKMPPWVTVEDRGRELCFPLEEGEANTNGGADKTDPQEDTQADAEAESKDGALKEDDQAVTISLPETEKLGEQVSDVGQDIDHKEIPSRGPSSFPQAKEEQSSRAPATEPESKARREDGESNNQTEGTNNPTLSSPARGPQDAYLARQSTITKDPSSIAAPIELDNREVGAHSSSKPRSSFVSRLKLLCCCSATDADRGIVELIHQRTTQPRHQTFAAEALHILVSPQDEGPAKDKKEGGLKLIECAAQDVQLACVEWELKAKKSGPGPASQADGKEWRLKVSLFLKPLWMKEALPQIAVKRPLGTPIFFGLEGPNVRPRTLENLGVRISAV